MPYTPPPATFKAEHLVVHSVGETQVISDKFSKRELVLTDRAEKYPLYLSIQFQRKKTGLLDKVRPGDTVSVYGYLSGRYHERSGRYFVDVVGEELHRENDALPGMGGFAAAAPAAAPSPRPVPDHIQPGAAQSDLSSDLPF